MRNKKLWLALKGLLIILLTILIFTMPTQDNARKWFRFAMLVLFVTTFLVDLNNLKKNK
jgi:uncharacterized integral membrane protein